MIQINPGRHKAVHSDQLERWLGDRETASVSDSMCGWYGPPIALAGVPGAVYAGGDGDFSGDLRAGYEASWRDRAMDIWARYVRASRRMAINSKSQCNAGFASVTDLITEARCGKRRDYFFRKDGATISVTNGTSTLWSTANDWPLQGGNSNSAPGGSAFTSADTGAFPFVNASAGDTTHFVNACITDQSTLSTLMVYDRLFGVNKIMNSVAAEAVTGVPTRYQSTTDTDPNWIGGNFMMVECQTALPATAHNWTTCTYTDNTGAASTFPSITGIAGCNANTLDMTPGGKWWATLETGDRGVGAITQIQCSALVATGVISFTIGHPIAIIPYQYVNFITISDGISTAFNLARIFDNACLSLLEFCKASGGAAAWNGYFTTVSG